MKRMKTNKFINPKDFDRSNTDFGVTVLEKFNKGRELCVHVHATYVKCYKIIHNQYILVALDTVEDYKALLEWVEEADTEKDTKHGD